MVAAALGLTEIAAAQRWRGPDPYDGLWWRWPAVIAGGRRRRQMLIQLHARSPVDLRRLYRRTHPLVPKALGVYGSVGLRLHRLSGEERARVLALDALETLMADRTAGHRGWGYPWDMQTRWSFFPAGTPNVVVTAFGADGLHEAAKAADRGDMGARAQAAAEWVLDELWLPDEGFFAYHRGTRTNIHNANLLGAWLVQLRLGRDPAAREAVGRALERTLAAQSADGSWPYGEGRNLRWVDSFHSGYVLTCLARLSELDPRIDEALERGAGHYERFFDVAGRAKLWADRRYPEDAHSAGTGMSTLAVLAERGLVDPELLQRVARRTLLMGVRDGHAVHRRYGRFRSRPAYLRWADAHLALGLADGAALGARESPLRPDRSRP
jgi:hypothetical protein